jgi:uncharacterized protein
MTYLLDTNIWLELLLDQSRKEQVRTMLRKNDISNLAISDFSVYSIGIILTKLKRQTLLRRFLNDVLGRNGIALVRIPADRLKDITTIIKKTGLDFDDAYQYLAAECHDLRIVSLDSDFDKTDSGRLTPAQAC